MKNTFIDTDEEFKYYGWLYMMGMAETLRLLDAPARASITMEMAVEGILYSLNATVNPIHERKRYLTLPRKEK